MNLHEKLIEIRKVVPYLQKDASGYKFQYASAINLIPPIKAKMDELKVLLYPEIIETNVDSINIIEKEKPVPNERISGKINYVWINAENPDEKLTVPFFMVASQKDPARAFGSALTYAERYFLLKFFNIPTGQEDPDFFNTKNELNNAIKNGAIEAEIPEKQFKARVKHWAGQKWRVPDLTRLNESQVHEIIENIPKFVEAIKNANKNL